MKKVFMLLLVAITAMKSLLASDEKIKLGVLNAFKKKFPDAKEVSWQVNDNNYKVAFTYYGAWMSAYYNGSGELLGVTRNISSLQLPLYLQNSLREKFAEYWITNVVEESNKKGYSYYITINDADYKIVLLSKYGSGWTLYSKQQKQ